MICAQCNKAIADDARFCPECGAYIPPVDGPSEQDTDVKNGPPGTPGGVGGHVDPAAWIVPRKPPRTPHLCWWNLLVSGLAQMIHGQMGKGVVWLVLTIASNMMFPVLLALVIGAASVIDAYMVGKALQRGFPVGKWEWFPKR